MFNRLYYQSLLGSSNRKLSDKEPNFFIYYSADELIPFACGKFIEFNTCSNIDDINIEYGPKGELCLETFDYDENIGCYGIYFDTNKLDEFYPCFFDGDGDINNATMFGYLDSVYNIDGSLISTTSEMIYLMYIDNVTTIKGKIFNYNGVILEDYGCIQTLKHVGNKAFYNNHIYSEYKYVFNDIETISKCIDKKIFDFGYEGIKIVFTKNPPKLLSDRLFDIQDGYDNDIPITVPIIYKEEYSNAFKNHIFNYDIAFNESGQIQTNYNCFYITENIFLYNKYFKFVINCKNVSKENTNDILPPTVNELSIQSDKKNIYNNATITISSDITRKNEPTLYKQCSLFTAYNTFNILCERLRKGNNLFSIIGDNATYFKFILNKNIKEFCLDPDYYFMTNTVNIDIEFKGTLKDWCNIKNSRTFGIPTKKIIYNYIIQGFSDNGTNNTYDFYFTDENITRLNDCIFKGIKSNDTNKTCNIYIGKNITSIGRHVFVSRCKETNIYFEKTLEEYENIEFVDDKGLAFTFGYTSDSSMHSIGTLKGVNTIYILENNEYVVYKSFTTYFE